MARRQIQGQNTDPVLQVLLGKYKPGDSITIPGPSQKTIARLPPRPQGSLSFCGKEDCKETPTHFGYDLMAGVPRYLCKAHAARWIQKRRLIQKDFPELIGFFPIG